jgi:hypothetical protein
VHDHTRHSSTTSCRLTGEAGLALCMADGPWMAGLHARPACRLAVPKTEQTHFTRPPPPTTRPTPSDPRTLARQHHRPGNAALPHGSLRGPCNGSCTGLAMPAPQYCASSPISVVTVPVSMQVKPLPPCKHSKQMPSVNCTHPGKSGATSARCQSRCQAWSTAPLPLVTEQLLTLLPRHRLVLPAQCRAARRPPSDR